MKLIISILLLGAVLLGCTSKKSFQPINKNSNTEAIKEVFSYLTKNKFGHHLPQQNECTLIYPRMTVLEESAYYNIWHHHLLKQRDTINNDYLFRELNDPFLTLDTIDLKKKVFLETSFERIDKIDNLCIQYYENGSNANVLYFTPMIKMNKKDYYHIALKVMDDREFPEFLFIIKQEKDGSLKVVHHIWGDDWTSQGIGNKRNILKEN